MNFSILKTLSISFFIGFNTLYIPNIHARKVQISPNQKITTLGPHLHRQELPQPIFQPIPPHISAQAYLLIDAYSGQVLAAKNSEEKLPPASLTKMMVSYLLSSALQAGRIKLDEKVTVSEKAASTGGSRMFIAKGVQVPVQSLLQGVVVQSGNDASVALAEHLAGDEESFVKIMNQEAKRIGMKDTQFVNVTGLPHPDHYTTPLDMATLARAIILDFPQHYIWYAQKSFTYSKIKQLSRNKLLWDNMGVDGIKTGQTDQAGYCLVASALKEEMRLVAVVMQASSEHARRQSTRALLNYGFRFFETFKIFQAYEPLGYSRVWFGTKYSVSVGLIHDLYVTILRGIGKESLKTTVYPQKFLKAPVLQKTESGEVEVTLNDDVLISAPLVTLKSINQGAWWKKSLDRFIFFFSKRWN